MSPLRIAAWLLVAALAAPDVSALAFELPSACAAQAPYDDADAPVAVLRARVEEIGETDPFTAVSILCTTIPRVGAEYGEDSLEFAWWVQTLATPLIAYMEEFPEAVPLLEHARPILEREKGPDSAEIAEIHVAYAWIAFRHGRLADAGEEWEQALRIRERVPGPRQIELQKVLVGLAHVRLSQREFGVARDLLERAQRILAENGESVSEAAGAIENALANIAFREEDYARARQHAEAQLAIELELRAQRGPAQPVTAYLMLGQALERLAEFSLAEEAMREAMRLSESSDGPLQRQYLRALTGLGTLLSARGKPREALPVSRRAVEVAIDQLGADSPNLVRVLLTRAGIERTLGNLPESLALYEHAGRIVAAHPDDVEQPVRVDYYRGLGLLQYQIGAVAEARATLVQGLDAAGDAADLQTERAAVLLLLARINAAVEPATAQRQLAEARRLYAERLPDGHPTLLRVATELCTIDIAAGAPDSPDCADATERLAALPETEPALRHAVYANESDRELLQGRPDGAYAYAVRALAAATTLGTPDPEWQAQYRLARRLNERGDAALAIFFGKQSLARVEALRAGVSAADESLLSGFLQDKVDVYRAVADWLFEAGRIDEGLDVLGLLKAEELRDFVPRAADEPAGRPVRLTAREELLRDAYFATLQADATTGAEIDTLSRLRASGHISPAELDRLGTLLRATGGAELARTRRIDAFIADTQRTPPAITSRAVSASRLATELERYGPGSAIGVYLVTDAYLRLIVATGSGQSEHRIDVDAATLRREIGKLLDGIDEQRDIRGDAQRLYDTLLGPLADAAGQAGASRLVLWPDDALRYVPFAALHDGHQYVVERFALQLFAEQGVDRGSSDDGRDLTVRGLGVTQALGGFRALPAVADELCDIVRGPIAGLAEPGNGCDQPLRDGAWIGRGAIRGEGYANAAFTEARLGTLLGPERDFSVLHVGTHFDLRPGNAMRSFLLLGDGAHLTLDRVSAFDFSGIRLTTLSGCHTAMGGATDADGREVEGLSAIVQRRGADSVIASLWRVEDRSTASLMRRLYGEMAAMDATDDRTARALQRAQLSLLDLHPYFWAGFLLSSR